MKKIGLIITLLVITFSLNVKEIKAETILGFTTIKVDAKSYPNSGALDASGAIADYHNWGLRMYFVDDTTGTRYGVVKDFVASSPRALSQYFYYGAVKKDIYNSEFIGQGSLKQGYENFVQVGATYYKQNFPTDPGKDKDNSVKIEEFFMKLYNTKLRYPGNDKITNALQAFLIDHLKVPASQVEKITNEKKIKYYIMVEPVRYFRVVNGLLALTSAESPLVINEKNYTNALYRGVTVNHPYKNDVTYYNVIPTSECLRKIADGTMSSDVSSSSAYRNCKSIYWWQYNTLTSYTPKSVVHTKDYTIGGFLYSKFTNKGDYSVADVVGVKEGLGLGFVNVSDYLSVTEKQCKDMTTAEIFTNLPKCCSDSRAVGAPDYKTKCSPPDEPDEPIVPGSCNYFVTTKYPTSCTDTTEGKISDINDWQCIFDSKTLGGSDYKDHYIELENKYCSVFCREDIDYKFPNNSFTVLAGNHFTIGSNVYGTAPRWNPVYIAGSATCKTNGIDHNKFASDWNAANAVVNDSWNKLQIELAKQKSIDNKTTIKNSGVCGYINNVGGFPHCSEVGTNVVTNPVTGATTSTQYCKTDNYDRYDNIVPAATSYNGVSYKQASYCSNKPDPSFDVITPKNTYNSAVSTRDSYLTELNQCVNYKFDYSSLLPKLQMEYEEEKYGVKLELIPDFEEQFQTTKLDGGTGLLDSYICDKEGSVCTLSKKSVSYPTSDNILHRATKIINYSLKNDVYRYVDKVSGLSTNVPPSGNYTDIGYGILPIDFNRESGEYDISLTYGNLGTNNKFNDFILKGIDSTVICPGTYECTYNVKNEVLCDKDETKCDLIDLSVVFRPVSLSNPFPGLDGENRNPGSNWIGYENLITYNRGVKDQEIYTARKPMYEITLDSKTIRKIRSYNAKNSYTDFNLECKDGSSKECVSSFLTTLKNGSSAANSLKISSCARTGNEWNDTCKVGG